MFKNKRQKNVIKEFSGQTEDIKSMANWLKESNCEKIAMESTASYWKPLVNIFEITDLKYTVINARDYKNVPGKKTDVMDAEWIADLLQHGILKDSFIPTRQQRELREATRYRKSLTEERARELNRLQKMLEGASNFAPF
ncbi:MAG: transposase [Bacilli bacterium]|nr:transposase [Bacilli bacterium]